MERAVQWYALITCLVIGLSHIMQRQAWADVFAAMHRLGKPGAFINGALSLVPGAVFVAAHPVWSGPAIVLTLLGWLLVIKGSICFVHPNLALRSLAKAGAYAGREFAVGGLVLWAIAAAAGYALWIE
jgi:hypothetical protein